MMSEVFTPRKIKQGKVRDIYEAGDYLLLVATDRVSAFDVILPTPIPGKGKILTALSHFWFEKFSELVCNHLSGRSLREFVTDPAMYAAMQERTMVVRKAKPLAVEAIVRGYLSGSGWKEYRASQSVCGIALPAGLEESSQLPQPLYTPSTKAEVGEHDQNIDYAQTERILGSKLAGRVRDLSLALYSQAATYARTRGIIIADTKFEFGMIGDELVLIDEMLTPDSSRFWPLDQYRPGGAQPSFDKQFIRDWLEASGWDKLSAPPQLPAEIVTKTLEKYETALAMLTH
jgi:phosphoribosylaminoimidazole-succinocarboxamide synthase